MSTVTVGTELPVAAYELTATHIVAGAIASRDFMPVHHDRDYANAEGAPDLFMNILSTTGWCSRFVTDWAGPEAIIRHLDIRLGVPVFPGATLTFTGSVTGAAENGEEAVLTIAFAGATDLGDHVTGTATITLPRT